MDCNVQEEEGSLQVHVYDQMVMSTTRTRCESSPSYKIHRARILKRFWSPGIDFKELIPPVYVTRRAGTIILFLLGFLPP